MAFSVFEIPYAAAYGLESVRVGLTASLDKAGRSGEVVGSVVEQASAVKRRTGCSAASCVNVTGLLMDTARACLKASLEETELSSVFQGALKSYQIRRGRMAFTPLQAATA